MSRTARPSPAGPPAGADPVEPDRLEAPTADPDAGQALRWPARRVVVLPDADPAAGGRTEARPRPMGQRVLDER